MRFGIKLAYWLSLRKRISAKASLQSDVFDLIRRLRPVECSIEMIRLGSNNDGGYLVPNILDGVVACFSPGVSNNTSFEDNLLSRFNIPSFLTDPSIEESMASKKIAQKFNLEFKYLRSFNDENSIDLSTWIKRKGLEATPDYSLILQMDIEGGEYEVLTSVSDFTLSKFRYLVIEFHEIEKWNEKHFFEEVKPGFQKLLASFLPVHFHPNNHNQYGWIHGRKFPKCFEVTLVNKAFMAAGSNSYLSRPVRILPHPLDQPNNPEKPDIFVSWDEYRN